MKLPKTAKGFINLLRKIEKVEVYGLKGFDKLSANDRYCLLEASSQISNAINEVQTQEET